MAEKIKFISQCDPNNGEIALIKSLGYSGLEKVVIEFSDYPIKELLEKGIRISNDPIIAIVTPHHICNVLLNAGFILIEFVNFQEKRTKSIVICKGAYLMELRHYDEMYLPANAEIYQRFISCPLSINEQYENSLI